MLPTSCPRPPPMRGSVHTACGKSGWVSHLPPCTVLRKGIQASAAGARSTVTRPERSGDLSRSGCSTVNTLAEQRPGGGSGQRSHVCGPGPAWHAASPSETPFAAGLGLWHGKWRSGAVLPHQGLGVPVVPPSTCSLSHPWVAHPRPPGLCWGLTFPLTEGEVLHFAPLDPCACVSKAAVAVMSCRGFQHLGVGDFTSEGGAGFADSCHRGPPSGT